MKILGADGLVRTISGEDALDQIPSHYIVDGDCACAKFDNKFYWYVLAASSAPENLPNVVEPKVGVGTESTRWLLRNIYLTEVDVQTVYTNTITQSTSGVALDLNGVASLSGNTFSFTNITEAPFNVNSNVMVDNLNVEYLGGKHWSEFELENILRSGDIWITPGVDEVYVAYHEPPMLTTTYSLFTELFNLIEPSIITYTVTDKTLLGFTIKLSAQTDNSYYRIQWAILGENTENEEYDLLDVVDDTIADKDGIPLTVF